MSSTDGRPLVSTQDSGPESNKSGTGCLGCLSQIVGLIFIIILSLWDSVLAEKVILISQKIPVVNLLYKLRQ